MVYLYFLNYSLEKALRLARNFQKENKEIAIPSLSFLYLLHLILKL